jgi:hypothetical protein
MEVPGAPLSGKVVSKIILLVRPLAHLRHIMFLVDVSHDRNPALPSLRPIRRRSENLRNLSKKLSAANHLCHTFHHILTTNYHPLKRTNPSKNAPSTIAGNPLAITQKKCLSASFDEDDVAVGIRD